MSNAVEDVKGLTLELIEKYRQCPSLWDPKCDGYSNRESRSQALSSLLVIYKKMEPNATIEQLKKKLENIKSSYKRELRKVKIFESSEVAKGRVYVPRLWYYEHMTFLDGKNDTRDGVLNEESLNTESTLDGADHTRYAPATSSRASTPSVKRKKRRPNIVQKALLESVKTLVSSKEEEWEVIGRSLGLQLKQLNSHQQAIALKLMSDVIFLGKREKLGDHSSITLCPPFSNLHVIPSQSQSSSVPSTSAPPLHNPLTSSQLSPLTPDIPSLIKLRVTEAAETPLSSEY